MLLLDRRHVLAGLAAAFISGPCFAQDLLYTPDKSVGWVVNRARNADDADLLNSHTSTWIRENGIWSETSAYADVAGHANTANTATTANFANTAATSNFASTANTANSAATATYAASAGTANHATTADTANFATSAGAVSGGSNGAVIGGCGFNWASGYGTSCWGSGYWNGNTGNGGFGGGCSSGTARLLSSLHMGDEYGTIQSFVCVQ